MMLWGPDANKSVMRSVKKKHLKLFENWNINPVLYFQPYVYIADALEISQSCSQVTDI